jgi:hypothetical protein
MTKKDALEQVRRAKLSHKKWISHAKAIHMGIPVGKDAVPMNETECNFGNWYYGEGQIFSNIPSYQAIEEPHGMLHHTYMKLYKARKKPIKSGLFVSKSKAQAEKQQVIEKLMSQLLQISEILMDNLKEFENDLRDMPDSEFYKLV